MRRREFITLLSGAAIACPPSVRAQTQPKMLRVGVLSASQRTQLFWVAFEQRLRELGYLEGQNLAVEFILVRGQPDRYGEAAQELIRRKADIIVVGGAEGALQGVMAATSSLPIVADFPNSDPIARGIVTSLARPTGNVTGVYDRRLDMVEKQIELLAQTFPERTRLGVLWDAGSADVSATERPAAALHLELHALKLENPPYDFVAAFRTLTQGGAQMLLVLSSALFNEDRAHIAGLALQHGLPSMFVGKLYVDAGGLLSYGPSTSAMYRRLADYVDRIAKGAKPSDLPIEQPTKFELALNLKTARALGLTLPPSLIARADEVIE
jgi:putative tryptophan/tyrosine transport system substrate-binding protein